MFSLKLFLNKAYPKLSLSVYCLVFTACSAFAASQLALLVPSADQTFRLDQISQLGLKPASLNLFSEPASHFNRAGMLLSQKWWAAENQASGTKKSGGAVGRFGSRVKTDAVYAGQALVKDFAYFYSSPARINKRSAIILAGIFAAGGALYAFDQEIYEAIQRNQDHVLLKPILEAGDFLEPLGMQAFTNKYIFSGFAVGYLTDYKPLLYATVDLIEAYLIAGTTKNVVVRLIGRRRPREGYGPYHYQFLEGTSLPSGHASNAFQYAVILSHYVDRLPFTIGAYSVAGLIALQRVGYDAHWPSDVYVGAVFGAVMASEILKINDRRRLKIEPVSISDGQGVGIRCRLLLDRF